MSGTTYRLIDGYYSWEQVIGTVLSYPKHTNIIVLPTIVPSLPDDFKQRIGILLNGCLAHFSKRLPDGKSIHVRVYKDHYKVHWDQKDPNKDPWGHLVYDAPEWLLAIGMGAAIGIGYGVYSYYKRKNKKRKI